MEKYKLHNITTLEKIKNTKTKVYDITVEDNHSYCITTDNIIVHNSTCLTRLVAGCGVPQLSAIIECADAAHGLMNGDKKLGLVCSDGGVVHTCDFAKGIGAGADFIAAAGYWAGAEECEGEWLYEYEYIPYRCKLGVNGIKFDDFNHEYRNWSTSGGDDVLGKDTGNKRKKGLKFHGMSSVAAQKKHNIDRVRISEGRETTVPYKGPLQGLIDTVLGGLASTCSYVGTNNIKHLSKCTTFVKVSRTHNRSLE